MAELRHKSDEPDIPGSNPSKNIQFESICTTLGGQSYLTHAFVSCRKLSDGLVELSAN